MAWEILKKLAPAIASDNEYQPVPAKGDGNCLWHVGAKAGYGKDELWLLIKIRSAIFMFLHPQYYDDGRDDYVDPFNDSSPHLRADDYRMLLEAATKLDDYSSMQHIHAMSSVLGVCIRTYCPPYTQFKIDHVYTKIIRGHGIPKQATESFIIMWSCCYVPKRIEDFFPDHFVYLQRQMDESPCVVDVDEFPTLPTLLKSLDLTVKTKDKRLSLRKKSVACDQKSKTSEFQEYGLNADTLLDTKYVSSKPVRRGQKPMCNPSNVNKSQNQHSRSKSPLKKPSKTSSLTASVKKPSVKVFGKKNFRLASKAKPSTCEPPQGQKCSRNVSFSQGDKSPLKRPSNTSHLAESVKKPNVRLLGKKKCSLASKAKLFSCKTPQSQNCSLNDSFSQGDKSDSIIYSVSTNNSFSTLSDIEDSKSLESLADIERNESFKFSPIKKVSRFSARLDTSVRLNQTEAKSKRPLPFSSSPKHKLSQSSRESGFLGGIKKKDATKTSSSSTSPCSKDNITISSFSHIDHSVNFENSNDSVSDSDVSQIGSVPKSRKTFFSKSPLISAAGSNDTEQSPTLSPNSDVSQIGSVPKSKKNFFSKSPLISAAGSNDKEQSPTLSPNIEQLPCSPIIDRSSPHLAHKSKSIVDSDVVSDVGDISYDDTAEGGMPFNLQRFHKTDSILQIMREKRSEVFRSIPLGRKENVYFLLDATENQARHVAGEYMTFPDDCGAYGQGRNDTYYFHRNPENNVVHTIYKRSDLYCSKKYEDKTVIFEPLDPQPPNESVYKVLRKKYKLKSNENFQKIIVFCSELDVAFVGYSGQYPDNILPHGNAKNSKKPYFRSSSACIQKIKKLVQSEKPKSAYTKMKKVEVEDRARNHKQCENLRYRHRKLEKEKLNPHQPIGKSQTFADNVKNLINSINSEANRYVQHINFTKNKCPYVVLYTWKQIEDMKRFCCPPSGAHKTIISVDKTYNVSTFHVTMTCYRSLALKKYNDDKEEHYHNPIHLGPTLIHGDSDTKTFAQFFDHIKNELGTISSYPVLGSDNETALRDGFSSAFPRGSRILCERHMEQNLEHKLVDKLCNSKLKKQIRAQIFGKDGMMKSKDFIQFRQRERYLLDDLAPQCPGFLDYYHGNSANSFQQCLIETFTTMKDNPYIAEDWKNNDSESMNNVLKLQTDWQPQDLETLILKLGEMMDGYQSDYEQVFSADQGDMAFPDFYKNFICKSKKQWHDKTAKQRESHFRRFLTKPYLKLDCNAPSSVSSDGMFTVKTSKQRGRKPGQRTRTKSNRTRTIHRPSHRLERIDEVSETSTPQNDRPFNGIECSRNSSCITHSIMSTPPKYCDTSFSENESNMHSSSVTTCSDITTPSTIKSFACSDSEMSNAGNLSGLIECLKDMETSTESLIHLPKIGVKRKRQKDMEPSTESLVHLPKIGVKRKQNVAPSNRKKRKV